MTWFALNTPTVSTHLNTQHTCSLITRYRHSDTNHMYSQHTHSQHTLQTQCNRSHIHFMHPTYTNIAVLISDTYCLNTPIVSTHLNTQQTCSSKHPTDTVTQITCTLDTPTLSTHPTNTAQQITCTLYASNIHKHCSAYTNTFISGKTPSYTVHTYT